MKIFLEVRETLLEKLIFTEYFILLWPAQVISHPPQKMGVLTLTEGLTNTKWLYQDPTQVAEARSQPKTAQALFSMLFRKQRSPCSSAADEVRHEIRC